MKIFFKKLLKPLKVRIFTCSSWMSMMSFVSRCIRDWSCCMWLNLLKHNTTTDSEKHWYQMVPVKLCDSLCSPAVFPRVSSNSHLSLLLQLLNRRLLIPPPFMNHSWLQKHLDLHGPEDLTTEQRVKLNQCVVPSPAQRKRLRWNKQLQTSGGFPQLCFLWWADSASIWRTDSWDTTDWTPQTSPSSISEHERQPRTPVWGRSQTPRTLVHCVWMSTRVCFQQETEKLQL